MHDARDAEDKRLLEAGEIDLLLAGWYETIVGRCVARMRGPVGHDVAQAGLRATVARAQERPPPRRPLAVPRDRPQGDRLHLPRLVRAGWGESEWLEIDGPSPDPAAEVDTRLDLETFVATLPPADGEVGRLWLLEGLEPGQIAERLDKKPNAVYQARSRITKRLREWLET